MPTLKIGRPEGPTITLTADAVQATVALVTETATATAGSTIAWTLQELAPGGTWTNATGMLSSTSGTSVTWTPTGLGYQYAVTAVATLNAQTATARRSVRCGQGQALLTWTQTLSLDFTAAATVAAPGTDGGSIVVGGLTIGTDNGDGGAGRGTVRNTNLTGLEIIPAASTLQALISGASTRTAPIALFDLSDLGLDDTDDGDSLILVQIASYTPVATTDYLEIGVESTTARMGTGGTGRGELFGIGLSGANVRLAEGAQVSGGNANPIIATSTAVGVRVLAMRLSGYSVAWYSSTSLNAMTDADPLSQLTLYSSGYARFQGSPPALPLDFLICVGAASAVSPPQATIQKLRVLKRAATLT